MAENKLADLSMDFAVEILKLCDGIKGHYSITNQLERSATSIGANIKEAKYAHSKPDFISKLQISLKECYETEYWLELMHRAEILPNVSNLMHSCGVIRKMLISSINTAKQNTEKIKITFYAVTTLWRFTFLCILMFLKITIDKSLKMWYYIYAKQI